jgi:hypothetical protein
MKLFFIKLSIYIAVIATLAGCAPQEWNDYSLNGSAVALPDDWNVSAADNDNTVTIRFDAVPEAINGQRISGIQFYCLEAEINFIVKSGESTTQYLKKVYKGGDYILQVAVLTQAGTGPAREISFKVVNNLLLTRLSDSDLTTEIDAQRQATDPEKVWMSDFYIEKGSAIALENALASDDVVFNLDFFTRTSINTVEFTGESGIYSVYYHPTRKFVFIGVSEPIYPNYLVALGKNFSYPAKQALDTYPFANYPQWAGYQDVLKYGLYKRVGEKQYQITVMLASGDGNLEFKAYHSNIGANAITSDWGNGGEYKYQDCIFSGIPDVFVGAGDGNNWIAGKNLDPSVPYRITLTVTNDGSPKTANVKVEQVDFEGNVVDVNIEEPEPADPDEPVNSTSIDPVTGKSKELDGETVIDIYHTLEKDAVYTLNGAMAHSLVNLDFFESAGNGKVKFLGENGDYHLIFNPTRNNMIIVAEDPAYPDFAFLCGVGLGYPTRTPQSVIGKIYPDKQVVTLDNWNFDNAYEYILMRKTSDNVYQATVMLPSATKYWWDGGPYASFKVYKAPDTDAANEVNGNTIIAGGGFIGNASDVIAEFADVADDGNISINAAMNVKTVRITIDLNSHTMRVDNFDLP